MASTTVRHGSRELPKLFWRLSAVRSMGGGPRTFPGGVSKWQYKRMHEKRAREKEKRLLQQEKQLYEARIRSEIRSKIINAADDRAPPSDAGPMSPKEHVKALADRFMKAGAEDLWNDDDGPVEGGPPLGKPLMNNPAVGHGSWPFMGRRSYSAEAGRRTRRYFPSSDDERDESEEESRPKRLITRAALGDYDRETEPQSRQGWGRRGEGREESLLTPKRFDECGISPLTVKALNEAGYVKMTLVQGAAIPHCLEGKDALVKARTGTGKSAAFLLPAIESVLKAMNNNGNARVPPIRVLILCPTRELASQIAAEANVLLRYHEGIGAQTLIGGIRFKDDQRRLESHPSQIIVATPGRLLDHIENKSGFSMRLMGIKLLILDEADHLLDLGFRKDIEKIVDCVPRQRQSLLFSATVPQEVRRISQVVLKREHSYIDTVGIGHDTHAKVLQLYLVTPHELHFQMVYHLLKEHIMRDIDYKVIVFCSTAMVTSLVFQYLRELKMNVREMHSKKPQLYRTRVSDEFRESKRLILVTSDVSARGINYPDVTLVIQAGIPSDREQYIHRLGRTGRQGKDGKGILLLAPWEEYFLDEIKDLPIKKAPLPELNPDLKLKIEESMGKIDISVKEAAYHAWLGYYNSIREIGRDKTTLAELANGFCASIGLQEPPSLFRKTAVKMGLRHVPGIRIRQ
ncbi:putative DEAD-box ATP-dependent RNA helicase 48 [Acorus calamus]|uniref:ATP-dependent RNA helicase n=1 Tax=Acorus calamus TaxID=4465 RepID=A0AAV9CPH9_ACOCL|nr:putative DEAD-box ATP-dependent RNA helicase 48 [Acorus calamus]